jgi:hypothetical protein
MHHALAAAARRRALAGGIVLALAAPAAHGDAFRSPDAHPWHAVRSPVLLDPAYALPKLSTLGVGIEYRYVHSSRFGLRLESLGYGTRRVQRIGLLRTELEATLHSRSLLFDWYPFNGKFRATTGIYVHEGELRATARYDDWRLPGGAVSAEQLNTWAREVGRELREAGLDALARELDVFAAINTEGLRLDGHELPLSQLAIATAYLRFPPYSPYIGIGWANTGDPDQRGFFYSIDLGVLDLGRPSVEYALNGALVEVVRPRLGSELEALIAKEEEETARKLARYRYYPVVSLGIGYRF